MNGKVEKLSFDEIYREYFRRVANTVYSFNFCEAIAEDLVQETFMVAWSRLETVKNIEAMGPWLVAIARNRCLYELRTIKRRSGLGIPVEPEILSKLEPVIFADRELMCKDYEVLVLLLRKLIVSYKIEPRGTIARLFYLEQMSVKEISDRLNLRPNTILSHLRRFRLHLSQVLPRHVAKHNLDITCLNIDDYFH